MNFKTTLVLIVLLAVAGVAVLFTRDKDGGGAEETDEQVRAQQKLLPDVKPEDVVRLVITPRVGSKLEVGKSGGKWRLAAPVNAPAEAFEVDGLVRAVATVESTSTLAGPPSAGTGLDKPLYVVDLTTSDGKTHTINVGDKSAVADSLYVALKGESRTHVVPADLLTQLAKTPKDLRDPKLVDVPTQQVSHVTITKPDGKLVLTRSGTEWKVTEPVAMPAEKTEVDDIVFALTGLRAVSYVAEDVGKEAAAYQLEQPRFTATLSTAATSATLPVGIAAATSPTTTGPAASQPAPVTIKFGRYEDVLKQNVLATTSQTPVVATVAATVLETINKKPLDLRDRRVLEVDPQQVSSITIRSDLAATTRPTSRPASKGEVTLQRRHEAKTQATTAAATTGPATTQSTTQAATQPASKWELAVAGETKPAEDSKVDSLLAQLNPLRASKYLESAPTTQPAAIYVVQITAQGAAGAPPQQHEVRLVDPGDSKPLVGTYNDLAFEVDRSLTDRLSTDFTKGSAPAPGTHDPHDAEPLPTGPPVGFN